MLLSNGDTEQSESCESCSLACGQELCMFTVQITNSSFGNFLKNQTRACDNSSPVRIA